MPAVVIKSECNTPEGLRDLYFRLPLKAGKKASDIPLEKVQAHSLIHCNKAEEADIISWTFGGTQRITRKGATRVVPADELTFLMHKYPGLVEVTNHADDTAGTTVVLIDRVKKVERELEVKQAELEQLAEKHRSAEDRLDAADTRGQELVLKLEKANADRDAALKDNLQLTGKLEQLQAEVAKLKKA